MKGPMGWEVKLLILALTTFICPFRRNKMMQGDLHLLTENKEELMRSGRFLGID
jgi:hypothetical protein